jgi:hypothetical protein
MHTFAVLHFPLSHKGNKMLRFELTGVDHTTLASAVKLAVIDANQQYHADRGMTLKDQVRPELMTVIVNSAVIEDTEPLAHQPLKPVAAQDAVFIHVRLTDPAVEAKLEELLAQTTTSCFINIQDVVVAAKA